MLGNPQGQSVFRGPFIDFEFRMIKATQVYRYPVPYISPFLTSIRMLVARIPYLSITLLGIAPNHVFFFLPVHLLYRET